MKYATKQNTKIGDSVLVPLNGEFMHDEQICLEYEVVLALKCKIPKEKQIVGSGQKELPQLIEFNDEMAYFDN